MEITSTFQLNATTQDAYLTHELGVIEDHKMGGLFFFFAVSHKEIRYRVWRHRTASPGKRIGGTGRHKIRSKSKTHNTQDTDIPVFSLLLLLKD